MAHDCPLFLSRSRVRCDAPDSCGLTQGSMWTAADCPRGWDADLSRCSGPRRNVFPGPWHTSPRDAGGWCSGTAGLMGARGHSVAHGRGRPDFLAGDAPSAGASGSAALCTVWAGELGQRALRSQRPSPVHFCSRPAGEGPRERVRASLSPRGLAAAAPVWGRRCLPSAHGSHRGAECLAGPRGHTPVPTSCCR